MTTDRFNKKDLKAFHEAAQSLRLYRRADLADPDHGDPLIEKLYVDPLPAEQILATALRPNTTFIIGRKGTGKSTIFQRLQFELRKKKHQTSAYIDIKTLFESAQLDTGLMQKIQESGIALPATSLSKLLIHKEFLKQVIFAIKEELQKKIEGSLWEWIKESVTNTKAELFESLDELLEDMNDAHFVSVLGLKTMTNKNSGSASNRDLVKAEANIKVTPTALNGGANISAMNERKATVAEEAQFTDILISAFNINEFLIRL